MEKKTTVPGIYKVTEGILINKDNEALTAYKKRRMKDRKIEMMEKELTEIKDNLKSIKELLMGLVNK